MDARQMYKSKDNPLGKGKCYPKIVSTVGNDATWRGGNAVKEIASFPFANPVGTALIDNTRWKTPGIMRFDLEPCYGHNLGLSGSLQKAADAYFTYITQGFVGTNPTFEAADLIVMQRAIVDGLYVAITEGKRAYSLVREFSNYNRYLGQSLLSAIGWDYNSIASNMMNFKAQLDNYIARINEKFHIPNDNNIHKIKQNYFGRMFSDRIGKKYQIYAFVPTGYPRFDGFTLETGSSLWLQPRPEVLTFSSYFNLLDQLLQPLEGNQDINIISGSFLRAYGESNCFKIPDLDKDTVTSFDYDPVILNQIHNINFCPKFYADEGQASHGIGYRRNDGLKDVNSDGKNKNDVLLYQNSEHHALTSSPIIYFGENEGASDNVKAAYSVIDISDENPSPEIILDSTAFKIGISRKSLAETPRDYYIYCSTDLVTQARIYFFDTDGTAQANEKLSYRTINFYSQVRSIGSSSDVTYDDFGLDIELLTKFDYAPFLFILAAGSNKATRFKQYRNRMKSIGDIYNFSYISAEQMNRIMDLSWYYMINVMKNALSVTK